MIACSAPVLQTEAVMAALYCRRSSRKPRRDVLHKPGMAAAPTRAGVASICGPKQILSRAGEGVGADRGCVYRCRAPRPGSPGHPTKRGKAGLWTTQLDRAAEAQYKAGDDFVPFFTKSRSSRNRLPSRRFASVGAATAWPANGLDLSSRSGDGDRCIAGRMRVGLNSYRPTFIAVPKTRSARTL